MARLRSVLGVFAGTMADVTFSSWKGKQVAKQKVPDNNTSNSPAQQVQRSRFRLLGILSRLLAPSLRLGFKTSATETTEQNVFVSRNNAAVTMVAGVATVDLTRLVVASGNVGPVAGLAGVYTPATGRLVITWTNNSNGADALPTDLVTVSALTANGGAVANLPLTASRSAAAAGTFLQLPMGLVANTIRLYAFAKRAVGPDASPSVSAPAA